MLFKEMSTRMINHRMRNKEVIFNFSKMRHKLSSAISTRNGIIILDRENSLNAINITTAESIFCKLNSWRKNNEIKLVLIRGSPSTKAFCAGGDIKEIFSRRQKSIDFFRILYSTNYLISTLSIPYIALIDGIVMGGGCGYSIHGRFSVVTERALFAMPETAIGFFPDVGASYFLTRSPISGLGLFLGLTGHRLRGRDILKAGIATHFVPSSRLPSLEEELLSESVENVNIKLVDEILSRYSVLESERSQFSLEPHIGIINSIFGGANSIEDILTGLRRHSSDWAKKQLEILDRMSPTSLKVTFEQFKRGKCLSLADCLKMEYTICKKFLRDNSDFYEGIRAKLVDKDNQPRWNPPTLEQVPGDMVQTFFVEPHPLDDGEQLKL